MTCRWDEEGGVWYVADSDVPGLATEAETLPLSLSQGDGTTVNGEWPLSTKGP